jgi:hypothetical protein
MTIYRESIPGNISFRRLSGGAIQIPEYLQIDVVEGETDTLEMDFEERIGNNTILSFTVSANEFGEATPTPEILDQYTKLVTNSVCSVVVSNFVSDMRYQVDFSVTLNNGTVLEESCLIIAWSKE